MEATSWERRLIARRAVVVELRRQELEHEEDVVEELLVGDVALRVDGIDGWRRDSDDSRIESNGGWHRADGRTFLAGTVAANSKLIFVPGNAVETLELAGAPALRLPPVCPFGIYSRSLSRWAGQNQVSDLLSG